MENKVQHQIVQFNNMYKSYDDAYQNAARNFAVPKVAFWLIYVLRQNSVCTQKDFMEQLYYPKQTVNSALKSLEEKGYVDLSLINSAFLRVCDPLLRRSSFEFSNATYPSGDTPKTGDGRQLGLRTVLIAVSFVGMNACLVLSKKEGFLWLRKIPEII